MEIQKFYDVHYETYLEEIRTNTFFSESLERGYAGYDELLEEADLYGKTVMVTPKQFKEVYHMISSICQALAMEQVTAFVYEDFYYGVEAKGSNNIHLEISAKTILDFSKEELTFLVARELYAVKIGGLKNKIIIEETLKGLENMNIPIAGDVMRDSFKVNAYKYLRSLQYSCDNYGYVAAGSIQAAFGAVVKLILNNKFLAEQVDLTEYLKQGDKISSLVDSINIYTKMDEKVPYGPDRMKNLLAFVVSKNGMEAIKHKE